jgi:hypothetical protein
MQILLAVVSVIKNINNYAIRYECCVCLRSLLKEDEKFRALFNFVELAQELIPIVVDLLGAFASSNTIWPLIDLLTVLFTKAQFSADQYNVVQPIESPAMEQLLKTDAELLISALADMLKVVIASFPPRTRLTSTYIVALKFIDYHFQVK